MTSRQALWPIVLAAALTIGMLPASGQPGFEFMPDGGRGMLRTLFPTEQPEQIDKLTELAGSARTIDEWRDYLNGLGTEFSKDGIETLAGYLNVNLPIDSAALQEAATAGDPFSAFPADGKELAIANCQFCHSIFSSYLMQNRDAQGWRSTFLSPFHRELKMSERERETFARYSAINMPLDYEDVPPELRF